MNNGVQKYELITKEKGERENSINVIKKFENIINHIMRIREISPIDHEKHEIPIIDGCRPYRLNTEGETAKHAFLYVHGLGGTPLETASIALKFRSLGGIFSAIRLPGHGTTGLDLENYTSSDWIDTVEKEINCLKTRGVEQIHLIGHSLGGLLSLYIAHKHPNIVKSIGIMATPISFSTMETTCLKFLGFLNLKLEKKDVYLQNEEVKQFSYFQKIIQNYLTIPYKAIRDVVLLANDVYHKLEEIQQPALLIHSKLDKTVPVEHSLKIISKLKSHNKKLVLIEEGSHALVIDYGHEEVEEELYDFFENIVSKQFTSKLHANRFN